MPKLRSKICKDKNVNKQLKTKKNQLVFWKQLFQKHELLKLWNSFNLASSEN